VSAVYQARWLLLDGALVTVEITILAGALAAVLAFAAGLARVSRWRMARALATAYVELFRGVSLLVQLFWLFFVLPFFGIELSPLVTAVVGLGLCNGAYGAEIVRAAIQAVPRPQIEAAIALNFTPFEQMRRVVLPQAIPAMLPPFGNLAIELLKATALVSLITIQDLAFQALTLRQTTMRTFEPFMVVLFVYFVLAMGVSLGFRRLERTVNFGLDRGGLR
jgi:polar amino acid transport system permease protein